MACQWVMFVHMVPSLSLGKLLWRDRGAVIGGLSQMRSIRPNWRETDLLKQGMSEEMNCWSVLNTGSTALVERTVKGRVARSVHLHQKWCKVLFLRTSQSWGTQIPLSVQGSRYQELHDDFWYISTQKAFLQVRHTVVHYLNLHHSPALITKKAPGEWQAPATDWSSSIPSPENLRFGPNVQEFKGALTSFGDLCPPTTLEGAPC